MARALVQLGNEPAALSEWNKAVVGNPNDPNWRFSYGKLLFQGGRIAEARDQLQKALELVTKVNSKPAWFSDAHRVLAQSFGRSPESVPYWKVYCSDPANSTQAYFKEGKQIIAQFKKGED